MSLTIEDVKSLPEGTGVRVFAATNTDWTKTPDGWVNPDGTTIRDDHLVGYIRAGKVERLDNLPPEVGNVYRYNSGSYHILIVAVEDNRARIGWVRNGNEWRGFDFVSLDTLRSQYTLADKPVWYSLVRDLATEVMARDTLIAGLTTDISTRDAEILTLSKQVRDANTAKAGLKAGLES